MCGTLGDGTQALILLRTFCTRRPAFGSGAAGGGDTSGSLSLSKPLSSPVYVPSLIDSHKSSIGDVRNIQLTVSLIVGIRCILPTRRSTSEATLSRSMSNSSRKILVRCRKLITLPLSRNRPCGDRTKRHRLARNIRWFPSSHSSVIAHLSRTFGRHRKTFARRGESAAHRKGSRRSGSTCFARPLQMIQLFRDCLFDP